MKIILVSGHKKNWNAGASTVYLHLNQELQQLPCQTHLFNAEDYFSDKFPGAIQKFTHAFEVERKILPLAKEADVIEVAGNIGWRLFAALRSLKLQKRPLLVVRLHGLEFKDEQARITEEIARLMKLPNKYKLFSRHWINWQEFKTLELADIVICHTSREADAIVTAGFKHESCVKVYPLGVDSDYISSREYRPYANKLLWWGSWIERKGIYTFPRAFELAARELPNLTLTLGGTGAKPQEILSCFPAELRSRITVLPFISTAEHQDILAEHDLFIFPSLSEGFGLALLEAMATGMPCITTLTGMYDWLEHGHNSYIVPMSAPTAVARAIKHLNADVSLRSAIGNQARETAQNLSWQQFGQRTMEVYTEHLSKIRGGIESPLAPAIC
ncbi:MAG: glycosyltransferase family 4 protein [Nostocaceae cyanobacterium]|nr:glycosyltransferase family 4 protein [Nostocaceae cyanobacterium]